MHALIIREPWIGFILAGKKTWEMRTTPTNIRGRIGLIRKGTGLVVGVVELCDSLPSLDAATLTQTRDRHGIRAEHDTGVLANGWVYPWVLRGVQTLRTPVPSEQKSGQVIWVPLNAATTAAIEAQLGARAMVVAAKSNPKPSPTAEGERPLPVAERPRMSQSTTSAADETERVIVTLTDGAIRNSNLSVRTVLRLLPEGVIGGTSAEQMAPRRLTVVFDPGETVQTDVPGDKLTLRCRGAVKDFFARSGVRGGSRISLRRDGSDVLRVSVLH